MHEQSLGQYVGSLKSSREQVRDRDAFLARCQRKYDTPSLAGLPMVGMGGSCGKPAFLLPFVVHFSHDNLERLEQVAGESGMFVEYGAYPHLKLNDGGKEIAAVQDWTNSTVIYMRPSYQSKEILLQALVGALDPAAS